LPKTLIILLAMLAPCAALAQAASNTETATVASIAECLVQGAPEGWQRLYMVVELAEPGAESGDVRYVAERGGEREAYVPCDLRRPARLLIESRKDQGPERSGWTGARLIIQSDGKFQLNFDYPK
jgi:hypothetical protein